MNLHSVSRRFAFFSLVLLLSLSAATATAAPKAEIYRVTITNLTTGQPFTPPAVVTHRQAIELFSVGSPASFGIQEIAENGNLTPLLNALDGAKHVSDVVVAIGDIPPLLPGSAVTIDVTTSPSANYLSFASMLICTNDGFTGTDTLRLPKKVGDTATAHTRAYDAGTEVNTEDFADIVPPCQALVGVSSEDGGTGMSDAALAENGVITMHQNVIGGNDLLVDVHGWDEPVAKIEITRID